VPSNSLPQHDSRRVERTVPIAWAGLSVPRCRARLTCFWDRPVQTGLPTVYLRRFLASSRPAGVRVDTEKNVTRRGRDSRRDFGELVAFASKNDLDDHIPGIGFFFGVAISCTAYRMFFERDPC